MAGDRVAIVGCGIVGALVGYLAAQVPGVCVAMIDTDASRLGMVRTLGCDFAPPDTDFADFDVVIHASATEAGLNTAIGLAGVEAKIIEASWYGTAQPSVDLGGRFHQRRLRLISSQVGRIPAHQSARWTYHRRLSLALSLLTDAALDGLISGEVHFDDLATHYGDILRDPATLCHRVRYGG